MVGRERVFARAGAEDGTAHPDGRGRGFILRVSVITHRYGVVVSLTGLRRAGEHSGRGWRGWQTERERGSAHISAHAPQEDVPKMTAEDKGSTKWYLEENQTDSH